MKKKLNLFAALFMLLSIPAISLASGPVRLTDSQLDTVAAGYVDLTVDADAVATGKHTYTDTYTDVQITEVEGDGYIVTTAVGYGEATAEGREAYTYVGANFDTDEEVLYSNYSIDNERHAVKKKNKKKKHAKKNNKKKKQAKKNKKKRKQAKKNKKKRKGKKNVRERSTIKVEFVTRRPMPVTL